MAWSYTPVLRALDRVRFFIGDTDPTDPQLQDEEIAFCLQDQGAPNPLASTVSSGVVLRAAVVACDGLVSKYGREITSNLAGSLAENAEQKFEHYQQLSATLRRRGARRGIAPVAPAISEAAKTSTEENPDRVQPFFSRDEMSEPGTGAVETDPLTGAILSGPST